MAASPANGSIDPAATAEVVVSFSSSVSTLESGRYSSWLHFVDTTTYKEQTHEVSLEVWPLPSLRVAAHDAETQKLQIELSGPPGQSFAIQRSSNLDTWVTVQTVDVGTEGVATIEISSGTTVLESFRAVHSP
jgi:hypothetical protein